MRWKSKSELQAELARYARVKLAAVFEPAPDEAWARAVERYFDELNRFDREAREALRLFDRSKAGARRIFEERGIPISFEFETFEHLPPTARVLLLALLDEKKKIGPVLQETKRTRTSTGWLPPAFTTRGFVIAAFETCAVLTESEDVAEFSWGPPQQRERLQLTDTQLAWIHTFVFGQETVGALAPDDLDRAPAQYIDDERRRLKKAREHYAEEVAPTTRPAQNGARFVLPAYR